MLFTPRSSSSHTSSNTNDSFFKARVQAKLAIGQPGDKYEVEADRTADSVVSRLKNGPGETAATPAQPGFFSPKPTIQPRKQEIQKKDAPENGEQDQEIQEKPLSESITPLVQTHLLPQPAVAADAHFHGTNHAATGAPVQTKCADCEAKEKDAVQTRLDASAETDKTPVTTPVQAKCADCEAKEKEAIQTRLDASAETDKTPATTPVQAKCADCEAKEKKAVQTRLDASTETDKTPATTPVQAKCAKCEETRALQAKEDSGTTHGDFSGQLSASKGGGSAMSATTQSEMSNSFGTDFSGVRIHTDSNAVQMNKELGAQAFTNGNDIYFNSGKYNPGSERGNHLLAHELTHTVQQGASTKQVQKREEVPEKEPPAVQRQSDVTIQLEGDPCAKLKDDKKADTPKEEESASAKDCKTRYIPAPQPAAGQEEPKGEEQPKNIEAQPKASAAERQKGAPPVDGGKQPKGGEPKAENPLEICDKRDAAAAEKGKKGAAKGAKAQQAPETPQPQETGKKGKKKGQAQGLVEAVAQQKKQQHKPIVPMGELSSPAIVAQRDESTANAATAMSEARGTQGAIREIGSRPVSFAAGESVDPTVNALASDFMKTQSEHAANVLESGLASAEAMQLDLVQKRAGIEADIAGKRNTSKAVFRGRMTQSKLDAAKAKRALNSQHAKTVQQINQQAQADKKLLMQSAQKMKQDILLKAMAQMAAINNTYGKSYQKHLQIGRIKGYEARMMGNKMSDDYRNARNPGATESDRDHVVHKKKDGFWDGYLTYNRYIARADSAKETAKQYQEGMQEQAKEKADKLMCEKSGHLMLTKGTAELGIQNLQCALDDALDSIELRKTVLVAQANTAREEYAKNSDAALAGTLLQLKNEQSTQDLLISDFGARQIAAMETAGSAAIAGMLNGVQQVAGNLYEQLEQFATSVNGNEAPDATTFATEIAQATVQFHTALQAASGNISEAMAQAGSLVRENHTKAAGIISRVFDNGITGAFGIYGIFNELIGNLNAKRNEFFTGHLQGALQGLQQDYDLGAQRMSSVVFMIGIAYKELLKGIVDSTKASEDSLREGMATTIQQDLRTAICAQAEKAAEEVEPWWKSVLKVLLIILVVVIVIALTVVTGGLLGPVFAGIGGALATGAAATVITSVIAGAVMGAFASFLMTVGFNTVNLAFEGKLTWSGAFEGAGTAALAGFIAGGIGGFAGPLIGIFGEGISTFGPVSKFLITEGAEMAFDLVGSIVGDLATGKNIEWSGTLFNVVVARVIANGMKIRAKKPKTTIETGTEKPSAETGGGKTTADAPGEKTHAETTAGKTHPETKAETTAAETGSGKKNLPETTGTAQKGGATKELTGGQQQAKKLGYPDAPEGYHWRKGPNGDPVLSKNPGSKGGKLKYDPETKQFVPDNPTAKTSSKKKFGDEADLEHTRTKNELNQKEFDLEMNSVNARRPGRKIDMEDGGTHYTEEVVLSNGHKWRKRLDGGWCRFSKKTCFPVGKKPDWKQRRAFQENDSGLKDHAQRHSTLSPEEYLARGKKNISNGKMVKGGGKYPDVLYFVRKVGDDIYSLTITNRKGGILSIDTWSKMGSPISKQMIIDGLRKGGITTKKNFWSNFN